MFYEILDTCINAIVDGLEDFFNVITYPSRKYIKTAIFVAIAFLAMSLAGLYLEMFIFVQWYEALTAVVILLVIYFVSDISSKQVHNAANKMMAKTSKAIADTKRQLASSTKGHSKSKGKKSVKKKPNKNHR